MSGKLAEDPSEHALQRAALVSLGLVVLKLAAYIPSGSLLVLTSLFDSLADTLSSLLNRYIHRLSLAEADREHPFGHGGFSVVGSLVQGLVILFFGVSLLVESLRRFLGDPNHYLDLEGLPLAFAILVFSAFAGFGVQLYLARHLRRLAKDRQRSLALLTDRMHYAGDALVNLVGAIGVAVVYWWQMDILDAFFGCVGAAILIFTAYPILKKCLHDIVHNEAPQELQQQIVDLVFAVDPSIKGIHHFRSRELGPHLFVDFHLNVDRNLSLTNAHALRHAIKEKIRASIPRADVMIHVGPDSEAELDAWQPSFTLPASEDSKRSPS